MQHAGVKTKKDYTEPPMAFKRGPDSPALVSGAEKTNSEDQHTLERRAMDIRKKYREYFRITCEELGVASEKQTAELKGWALDFEITEKEVRDREYWYEEDYAKRIGAAKNLYSGFTSMLQSAVDEKLISNASRQRWIQRLRDRNVGYKGKEEWITGVFPTYFKAWKTVASDRDTLLQDAKKKSFIQGHPVFGIILNHEKFLSLHFTKQRDLISGASGAFNARDKKLEGAYRIADAKLRGAMLRGTLAHGKAGVWLDRIFKSDASADKIEAFVNGNASDSLEGLMQNWAAVKDRYTAVMKKAAERGENSAARGFKLVLADRFLAMHYSERLSYVKQAEDRLEDAKNMANERPIFLRIRHDMDMKDWPEARVHIMEAKLLDLTDSQRQRLKSMEEHIAAFSGRTTVTESSKGEKAQERLDMLVQQMEHSHSEMVPLVKRLLATPNANRGIHQLRWIAYNNIWCRTHGGPYLDDEIARKGSSQDQAELTKYRAEQGQDIGRHDGLDHSTSDSAYFRKQETSKHKATFLHANMGAGGVVSALGEKLEHEQDPRWLYWTTLCPHLDGEPKNEAWMREFLQILSEMRSLTRTLAA